jgi:hypothetical protein
MRAITNTAMDSDVRTSPTFILRQATNRDREGPRGLPPPTPPDIRAYPAVRSLQHTHACQGVGELLPTAASRPVGHPAVQATRDWPLPPFRPALPLSTPTMPSADAATAISLDDFAAKSPFLSYATFLGTREVAHGQPSSCLCISVRLIKHSRFWMETSRSQCQLVSIMLLLLSGSCRSPRTFAPVVLQITPRGDALALPWSFGSTHTWTWELSPHA